MLDTNVLVSGLSSRQGPSRELVELARARRFDLVTSGHILEELGRVLVEKLGFGVAQAAEARTVIERMSIVVKTGSEPAVCRDPADNAVLAAAAAGHATLLITGDHDLLALHEHEGIGITSVSDGLRVIEHLLRAEAPG